MFDFVFERAPGGQGQFAMVMLPGAGILPADFLEHGFVDAVRRRGLAVDMLLVEVSAADYFSGDFASRIKPWLAHFLRGYSNIWLAGISLGSLGIIRLLMEGLDRIGGVMLLSPFLVTRGTLARVLREGGIDYWSPGQEDCGDEDTSLLCWLKDYSFSFEWYLGWGVNDRYAHAGELLAGRLPEQRVFRVPGDHDWPTWRLLWQVMLDAVVFPARGIS